MVLVPGPSIRVPVSELDLAFLSGPIFHHLFLPLGATEPWAAGAAAAAAGSQLQALQQSLRLAGNTANFRRPGLTSAERQGQAVPLASTGSPEGCSLQEAGRPMNLPHVKNMRYM